MSVKDELWELLVEHAGKDGLTQPELNELMEALMDVARRMPDSDPLLRWGQPNQVGVKGQSLPWGATS